MGYTFISGNVALDLAGTVSYRATPEPLELLPGPPTLADWVVDAELLTEPPEVNRAEWRRMIELREAIYRLAQAQVRGAAPAAELPADRELVNRTALAAPVRVQLTSNGSVQRVGDLTSVRASIAGATVELLGGPHRTLLKACEGESCSRLYLDNSRRGTRRWCDMRECGNRAKATAYRRRHASNPTLADSGLSDR